MTIDHIAPVDQTTAALVIGALTTARTRCMSPVAALNQAGLLLTDRQAGLIRHDTLMNAAEAVRNTRIKALQEAGLLAKEPTPAVVAKAIAGRLEWLAEQAKRGEFR